MRLAISVPLALALASLAPMSLLAQQASPPQSAATQRSPDATFVAHAAVGDLFEIESSKLALERSSNAAVREFATMMVEDHGQMSAKLKAAAGPLGITVPAELDPPHQKKLKMLRDTTDAEMFDRAYIEAQTNAHGKPCSCTRVTFRPAPNRL